MKNYELMYVIDPVSEDGLESVKLKIEGIITGREGVIHSFEKLGKKRLAYPIAKRQFGIYNLINLSGTSRIVQAIDQYLHMNPIVLRHIILAFTEKALTLRSETQRIQLEEAERMRLGGRPLTANDVNESHKEEEDGITDAVDLEEDVFVRPKDMQREEKVKDEPLSDEKEASETVSAEDKDEPKSSAGDDETNEKDME